MRLALPVLASFAATQRRDSLGPPLLGFNSPSQYVHNLRRRPLGQRHLSWGFFPLQCSRKKESTSLRPKSVGRLGGLPRDPQVVPKPPATVPLTGFSNLTAAIIPPSTTLSFSDRSHSWGSPFRDLFLPHSPGNSSSPECPLHVPPANQAYPPLGGNLRRRGRR